MQLGSLLALCAFALVVPPADSFDFSHLSETWEAIKTKITKSIEGGDGIVTKEEAELLDKLNATTTEQDKFHKALEELRESIKEHLDELPKFESADIKKMLEKLRNKVRVHLRKTGDNVEEVNEKAGVAGNLYQGDMILTSGQMDALHPKDVAGKRQAMAAGYGGKKWSTFYYTFHNSLEAHAKTVSQIAIKHWNDNTCINFVESSSATPRVSFFRGNGCYSYIGVVTNNEQQLSLGSGCDSVGTAAHEIGHALGFFHEQSRWDRDQNIQLMPNNVAQGWLDQFNKQTQTTNDNLGYPYDYGSVMHYGGNSASGNGQMTMRALKTEYQDTMGSDIVSFIDLAMMNDLYDCKKRCASSSTRCSNGGFPHPRDCNKCLCPAGYGGRLCNERPAGCGAALTATSQYQYLTAKVGAGDFNVKDTSTTCNWMITAPAGKKIRVQITKYSNNGCSGGCVYGGIELKWQANPQQSGSRYCCAADEKEYVTSETNVMPIIGYNRYGVEEFTISYLAI